MAKRTRSSSRQKTDAYPTKTQQEIEAQREKFKEVGLPLKCQGCGTDYRTNVNACPQCGKPWISTGRWYPEVQID